MKGVLSANTIFELAMFGIMILFLSFCGFCTFKHCFYIWRRKKRRRCDDSLESILDLLYNEDYYYLETGTPYLPDPENSSNESEKSSEVVGNTETGEACFDSSSSQGRSVKWSGPEKISIDKFKVCPQIVKPDRQNTSSIDEPLRPKLQRQIKFQLSGSSEEVFSQNLQSPSSLIVSPTQAAAKPLGKETTDRNYPRPKYGNQEQSGKQPLRDSNISIKQLVATSKFIGAAHRAKKKIRMQKRFPTGSFRYRPEASAEDLKSPQRSLEKKPLLQRSVSVDSSYHIKRKVDFVEHASSPHSPRTPARSSRADLRRLSSIPEKRDRKMPSPRSAFTWIPRPQFSKSDDSGTSRNDRGPSGDVEELCQEYERLEKTRYAEMLKKTKSFRRENLPFFHRKQPPS